MKEKKRSGFLPPHVFLAIFKQVRTQKLFTHSAHLGTNFQLGARKGDWPQLPTSVIATFNRAVNIYLPNVCCITTQNLGSWYWQTYPELSDASWTSNQQFASKMPVRSVISIVILKTSLYCAFRDAQLGPIRISRRRNTFIKKYSQLPSLILFGTVINYP